MNPQIKSKIKKWFREHKTGVTRPQFLLAMEYVKTYDYPIDIACKLALDSYVKNKHQYLI